MPEDSETLKVVLELGLREAANVIETAERLDTKTGVILGFVIVSVAEILGFLLLAAKEPGVLASVSPGWTFVCLVLGLAFLLLSLGFGFFELQPKAFSFAPSIEALIDGLGQAPANIQFKSITALKDTTAQNRKLVEQKAKLATRVTVCAGLALLCYSTATLLLAISVFFGIHQVS